MAEMSTGVFADGAAKGNPGPGGWGGVVVTPHGQATEPGGGPPHPAKQPGGGAAATAAAPHSGRARGTRKSRQRRAFVSERRRRPARAPRHVGRMRAPGEGSVRSPLQEGDEPGGGGSDPAELGLLGERRLTVLDPTSCGYGSSARSA